MILTGLAVGVVLGIVMQRGRFCVTGMLRDIFLLKSWRTFTGLLIVISVHAVGIAALTSAGIISPEPDTFAPIAVIFGSTLFGIGIVLAGGCASGTWYRSGEGLVGSWIALAMYALTAAMMRSGVLLPVKDALQAWDTPLTTVPATLGVSPWIFALGLTALTLALTLHFLRTQGERPATLANLPRWKRPLHVYTAGLLVGLIGVIAWPLSAASGRNGGLGITSPSANLVTGLVTGKLEKFDWGVLLVLGILAGSFLAAKATGEFRVRVPDSLTAVRAIAGGSLVGIGAVLAGGCNVGNGMVQTGLFGFQGWVSLLFIAVGVGVGTKLWLKPKAAPVTAGGAADVRLGLTDPSATVGASQHAPTDTYGGQRAASEQIQIANVGVGLLERKGAAASGAGSFTTGASTKARPLGEGRYTLDTLGAVCPFPLIEAKDVMASLSSGDSLVIDFDCTQATASIPQWAASDGHRVSNFHATGDASWQITVTKR